MSNEEHVRKIKQLEEELETHRTKVELDSNKLFEAEESLVKAREDIGALQTELEHHRIKRSELEESQGKGFLLNTF